MFWGDKGENLEQTAVIKEAEQACPGLQVQPNWDQGNYDNDLATKIGSGNAPDVFQLDGSKRMPEFVTDGAVADLTSYVQQDKLNLKSIFWPTCLPETMYNGHIYGLERDCGNQGMLIFNKDMFDARHVPYPTDKWTNNDLLAAAVKLSGNYSVRTDTTNRLRFGIAINADDYRMNQYMWDWGGDWLSPDLKTCTMTSSASQAGLQWWRDLAYVHHGAPTDSQQQAVAPDVIGGFHDQRYAMAFVAEWALNYVVKPSPYTGNHPVPFNWGVTMNPGGPSGHYATIAVTNEVMYKHAKNPTAAWWLIKYLTMGAQTKLLAYYGIGMGGDMAIVKTPEFLKEYAPTTAIWIAGNTTSGARAMRVVPKYDNFIDAVNTALLPYWKGSGTVQAATTAACKAVAPLLPK